MTLVKTHPEKCSSCKACLIACSAFKFKAFNPNKGLLRIKDSIPYNKIFFCDQVGCCAKVCPEKAIEKKGDVWIIDHEKCTGCEECVKVCKKQVIVMAEGKAWKCDLCGECTRHCPIGALELSTEKNTATCPECGL
jgi:ferredoxin